METQEELKTVLNGYTQKHDVIKELLLESFGVIIINDKQKRL